MSSRKFLGSGMPGGGCRPGGAAGVVVDEEGAVEDLVVEDALGRDAAG